METECTKVKIGDGIVVLTERLPHLLTASVGFWINFGSRSEPAALYGAAHFIEHMIFKGTATMGPRDLALAVESVGGSIGAAASEEKTYCSARVLPEHLPIAVNIISDMFANSAFPAEEFDREKQVVLEEIKGHKDSPEEMSFDFFLEDVYGKQGLGHSILGYEENIGAMTRDTLYALYKKIYRPAHLVVAVTGNFGDADVPALVAGALKPCGEPPCSVMKPGPSPADFTRAIRFRHKDTGQAHFCLGGPGIPYHNPDRYVYMVLDMVLSGGMSSRLFQEVRERRGLVYDISSTNTCFSDSGFFCVSASTRPENLIDVLDVTAAEIAKIRNGEVDAGEIGRVKEQLRVSMAMSFESVTSRMMKLARSEIYYGRNLTDGEIFDMIHAVTPEDIVRVTNSVFQPEKLVFSALGPYKGKKRKDAEKRVAESISKF